MVNYRYLGRSGLKVTEIIYGNWLTHGSQVENDTATACVRAALDAGITTFDTADVYANTAAETVLGEALKGERRESLEVLTKVYWPTGPKGANDSGLSRKHIHESINGSLRRLQTDYVDVYQAHRWDHATPLEETMVAFADVVRQGKALYIGVSEWTADQIRAGAALARELRIPLVSSQPQYSMLWRVIEEEVVPASREEGLSQIVWSPVAQGVLTGKYLPGQPAPEGSRGTDAKGGARMIGSFLEDQTILERVQGLRPVADELGLTMAQLAVAWVLQNDNVAAAIIGASRPEQVAENVKASGVTIPAELLARIDEVLGDSVVRDPAETVKSSPATR
ncbi:aldo/keto reductase [Cellulomonas sp. A375-1]|uniref:Aldo/keto reductase n=1 Tax=Cellulomonas gelida TaxID=1712 RepID=A0A4Y3KM22_9CELL|nr:MULTISPECIES: aldo/keto reductase family protein [Cellulomonas]KMM47079.1 aldo/keto reductase [Cellulomonas sp. A375-1]MCR6703692.1 aldo/keto reductase family protein [Cellulomonas sp.]GEA84434.1 aldo/keto reductase [Cellulomonas gelida]GGL26710.1 aldo/keto reductase [Cellulomonas gelida]